VEASARYRRIGNRDTLEYFVARVAPHAAVGFAGGSRRSNERVIARVTYPASRVSGRRIADDEWHRVSEQPRIGAVALHPRKNYTTQVGESVTLYAEALDTAGRTIGAYEHEPRRWTVESTESRARLSADTGESVVLQSDRIAKARVGVTIHGVTAYREIGFQTTWGFVEYHDGGAYYLDGKIDFVNMCTVHPDGRREYSPDLAEDAKRVRSMPIPADARSAEHRAKLLAAAAACKL
jgi:hypothetical protein